MGTAIVYMSNYHIYESGDLASQAVQLGNRERLLAFCTAVQKRCPVGAYIRPVAGATSGYGDEVIQ
jgi:cystathionine beta-lyase family protein involved in aluminum resistance